MFKVKLASEKDHNFVVDSFTNSSIGRMHIKLWKNTKLSQTRSSWLNCALRDDEAVYWVSIGHYEAVAVSN